METPSSDGVKGSPNSGPLTCENATVCEGGRGPNREVRVLTAPVQPRKDRRHGFAASRWHTQQFGQAIASYPRLVAVGSMPGRPLGELFKLDCLIWHRCPILPLV